MSRRESAADFLRVRRCVAVSCCAHMLVCRSGWLVHMHALRAPGRYQMNARACGCSACSFKLSHLLVVSQHLGRRRSLSVTLEAVKVLTGPTHSCTSICGQAVECRRGAPWV